ncbi:hypothetical protein PIN31009_03007 [Pandoraea iniqua]|uniref:hypothetical protein n=1 Tax=Pandoraea iniqua TaxID=2508288 RepID=UPI00123F1A8A|nr:hypothetical protein [Pandoraea iniqua]VVE18527.1 hypothetical protein PIN31009_03007 [Pandoraea iniqua]
MQINPSVHRILSLALAVIRGFFWPVAIALAIVAWGAFAPWQPSNDIKDKVKAFFAILFFIMFFFGQYKRVEKQTDDKDSFKSVNEKLLSLQELVRKIRPADHPETPTPSQISVGDASSLLVESRALLKSGHTLAALLQGGVAFEHALRAFARHLKGDESAALPLHQLIRHVVPQEMMGELHALRQIRNRLTHISEAELSDLPDANRVLDGYEWAVAELGNMVRRDEAA